LPFVKLSAKSIRADVIFRVRSIEVSIGGEQVIDCLGKPQL
jgi:hypothetical protein